MAVRRMGRVGRMNFLGKVGKVGKAGKVGKVGQWDNFFLRRRLKYSEIAFGEGGTIGVTKVV